MIKSVCIEIRSTLKSCQGCIVFKQKIDSEVNLKLKKSELQLEVCGKCILIKFENFIVEPLTLTNLKIKGRYLSFRVQGNFAFQPQSIKTPKLSPPTFDIKMTGLECMCHNIITSGSNFNRILPLPSSKFNPCDVFCHFHGGKAEENYLSPKVDDCFYSDNFIMINGAIINGCIKRNRFLKCQRCLVCVGTWSENNAKLWTACLRNFNITEMEQLLYFVKKAVSDPYTMFPKLLFECEENNSYLSIVVMDKSLTVTMFQQEQQELISLKACQVVKVKYDFYSSYNSKVKFLEKDPFHSLHQIQVHKPFIEFSVKYLISGSKNIPSLFSKIDRDCMTYLYLYD